MRTYTYICWLSSLIKCFWVRIYTYLCWLASLIKCFCLIPKLWSCGPSLFSLWKVSYIITKAVVTAKAIGKIGYFSTAREPAVMQCLWIWIVNRYMARTRALSWAHSPRPSFWKAEPSVMPLPHHLGRCLPPSYASATSSWSSAGPFSGSMDSDNLGEGKGKKLNCLTRSPAFPTVLI